MLSNKHQVNEYIWIAGTSGVGKATCIRQLQDETNNELRKLFGISHKFYAVGKDFNDYDIEDIVRVPYNQVIIKWQFKTHKRIQKLMELCPESKHSAFLLWRPFEIQIQDLHRRSPELLNDFSDTLKFDWEIIKKLFLRLQNEKSLEVNVFDIKSTPFVRLLWP